jgi:protein-tyrosine phosphatase
MVTELALTSPDLILTMTRDHRRRVVELAPSHTRAAFTLREFARLAMGVSDDELRAACESAGTDAAGRVRAAVGEVALRRGMAALPVDAADDDVIDPFRRSWEAYELSAGQIAPAVDEVVRVMRLALA